MQKIIDWTKKNEVKIKEYIKNRGYIQLLNEYYVAAGYSSNKAAAIFKCSRRAFVRYLSGERQVPMYIVKMMLQEMQISDVETTQEYEPGETDSGNPCEKKENKKEPELEAEIECNQKIYNKEAGTGQNDCKNEGSYNPIAEKDAEGRFIWYGKQENDVLFNAIYAYRTLRFHQTRFQAACELNIQEDVLYEYESGKRKITYTDIQKILTVYHLTLEELFPSLVSYDGRKTFLPLKPVYDLTIDGKTYGLAEEELYITDVDDVVSVSMWPSFPMQRYDSTGKPLVKYMPDELTVDEYINSEELIFMKEDMEHSYKKDVHGMKLPPNYLPLFGLEKKKSKRAKYEGYDKILSEMKLSLDGYTVTFLSKTRRITFDLESYIFSDSPWYAMLQDVDYFKCGELTFIGDEIPQNQCIVWPDGQYIRIIELYIEKYPQKHYVYPSSYRPNGRYDNWTIYDSEN